VTTTTSQPCCAARPRKAPIDSTASSRWGDSTASARESPTTPSAYAPGIRGSTLRLLTITPWFYPDTGGVERHVLEVARRLAERGLTVTVAAADNTRARHEIDELEGIEVLRIPAWPRGRDYLFAPGIYRLASDPRWDLIHFQSWHTAVPPVGMMAALRSGSPYVITPHGGNASPLRRPFRPVQRRALGPLLRRAEAVIALSEAQRDKLVEELGIRPDRTRVIPNGSDLVEQVDPAAVARERDAFGSPMVVSMGRLERFKGHQRAIAALPHLLATYPHAALRIIGEGSYESELSREAARLGVGDRVQIEFFAQDRRRELAVALAAADVGVLLSEYETQPVAIFELAALGVPVVVADSHGLRELAADGLARSVPLQAAPEAIAQALVETLEQRNSPSPGPPPLKSWQTVTDELSQLYEEVLRRRRPG
jgi:glycosyltransferase involved in cell wall biosynthesis